jgi:hypothetical protein
MSEINRGNSVRIMFMLCLNQCRVTDSGLKHEKHIEFRMGTGNIWRVRVAFKMFENVLERRVKLDIRGR